MSNDELLALARRELQAAQGIFLAYEALHLEKGTADGNEKANRNRAYADSIGKTLEALTLPGQQGASPSPVPTVAGNPATTGQHSIVTIEASARDGGGASAEDVERVAEAVHRGRFEQPERATPFADEYQRGKEYCRRIARAAIDAFTNGDAK